MSLHQKSMLTLPPLPFATRLATLEDVPVLVELMTEFYGESNYPLDGLWAAQSLAVLLHNPGLGCVWIIQRGVDIVGHAVLTVRFSMEFGGFDAFVDDLFIRPQFRRKGAATTALTALLGKCERRNVLALHVEVSQNNTSANGLYEKLGMTLGTDGRQMRTMLLNITC